MRVGEANEVKGSLDLALAWGYIADDAPARAKLRRLLALIWGLTNSQRLVLPRAPAASGSIIAVTDVTVTASSPTLRCLRTR